MVKQPLPGARIPGRAPEGVGVAIRARLPGESPADSVSVAEAPVEQDGRIGQSRPALAGPPLVVPLNDLVIRATNGILDGRVRSREGLRLKDPGDPHVVGAHSTSATRQERGAHACGRPSLTIAPGFCSSGVVSADGLLASLSAADVPGVVGVGGSAVGGWGSPGPVEACSPSAMAIG